MKKMFYSIAVIAMLFSLASCGEKEVPVESLSMESKIVVRVDSTYQLQVEMVPESKTAVVNWTSSDEGVATVSDGLVKGVSVGEAVITANVGNAVATCKVEVRAAIAAISLEAQAIDVDSVAVKLTPSIADSYYLLGFTTKETFEKYKPSDIIESQFEQIKTTAAQNRVTVKYVLDYYGYKGEKVWYANHLSGGTSYVMFAFAVNPDAEEASEELSVLEFTTKPVPQSSMTFDVSLEGRTLTITPSVDDELYCIQTVTDSVFQKTYNGDGKTYIDAAKNFYDSQYASYGGFYAILRKGASTAQVTSWKDGVKYTVICVGYKGGYTTDFYKFSFDFVAPVENEEGEEAEINEVIKRNSGEQWLFEPTSLMITRLRAL